MIHPRHIYFNARVLYTRRSDERLASVLFQLVRIDFVLRALVLCVYVIQPIDSFQRFIKNANGDIDKTIAVSGHNYPKQAIRVFHVLPTLDGPVSDREKMFMYLYADGKI